MNRSVLRGVVIILIAVAAIAVMLLLPGQKPKQVQAPNDDPWVLVSYDPDNPYGTYLGNGYIACRIKGDGVGSQRPEGQVGAPLPCYLAGLYDDEKLIATPTWSDLRFFGDFSDQMRIDRSADYKQTLDMKNGILITEATWIISRHARIKLKGKVEVILSRAQPNVGLIRATLTPSADGTIGIVAPVTNGSPQLIERSRTDAGGSYVTKESKISLGLATSLDVVGADVVKSEYGPGFNDKNTYQQYHAVAVKRDKPFTVLRFASLVNGKTSDEAMTIASRELAEARKSVDAFVADHKSAWAKLWEKDIIIDGPKKDQQVLHSCMFYLLQSVREGSQWSLPPMGLSDVTFSGHVFWDADVWMFPALILQHPELARAIVDYRYNTLSGAMQNARERGLAGAEYAWESGYSGIEDVPDGMVMRDERHINGDVALAQWQYFLATGDTNWLKTRGYPVLKATADYWVSRVKYNPQQGRYEILGVVPPDENADRVNNSVYTNAIAKMNLEFALKAAKLTSQASNHKWAEVAEKMYIPFDAANQRFVAFDKYKGFQAKQADTELLVYPLQFTLPGQDMADIYRNTFSYYQPKVMPNGPAMSASAHAVIAARLGDKKMAYDCFVKSYEPFIRGPFNYFNEKRSTTWEAMCFLTGAAGPLQSTIFGLAGARMDYDNPQADLQFSPCLPKQWKSMKVTGIQWRGKTFDVEVAEGNKAKVVNLR